MCHRDILEKDRKYYTEFKERWVVSMGDLLPCLICLTLYFAFDYGEYLGKDKID